MKRFIIGLLILVLVVIAASLIFFRSSSGFRSYYLVPENAVLLVESKDPLTAWDKIVHSRAWEHLSSNKKLLSINSEIVSLDSIVNSSKFLMKLVGKKAVMLSQHPLGNGKYGLLYIIEVGNIGKYKKPEKILSSSLGKNFEITSRVYNEYKIIEILDLKRGEYYFASLIKGKLIFSFEPKLVEASIDASEVMIVGRQTKFLDVYSKISGSGLLSIYINHNNLGPFIKTFSASAKQGFIDNNFLFTGISFDINTEGLITINGFSSLSDSSASLSKGLFKIGSIDLESSSVVPQRLASMAKVNFRKANDYFRSSMQLLGKSDYEEYLENLQKIEKKFDISLDENFFSWMDKEIVLLQTQPSNLGRSNEFAAILHASDSAIAAKNLQYIWRQIKKNSPVKIKNIKYKGYNVDYIAFPGFLKMLFGKALSKIEKPYFTQIGNNVIVSNHPQTIKNLIDDYLSNSTLKNSITYYNFTKLFESKAAMFAYFEPPVLFYNLKEFLSLETWRNLEQEKDYFTCFSQAGLAIELNDDVLHYTFKALYKPEIVMWKKPFYNAYEMGTLFNFSEANQEVEEEIPADDKVDTIPQIIIRELDADKQENLFDNGSIWQIVELKSGLKHGTFKEYFPNGEIKIKGSFDMDAPSGKWRYYNEAGELIKTDKY